MKRLWIATVILCGVVVLCVSTGAYRHHCIDAMQSTLHRLETAYRHGDVSYAQQLAQELIHQYEQSSDLLLCYTTHSDMAESQETVALLPTLLRQDSGDELEMEIARLRAEFAYLKQIDDPLLRNIL